MLRQIIAWLSRQRRAKAADAAPTFVPLLNKHGRLTGMMDRLTADYLESSAPNPTQHMLSEMFTAVTRVRVLEGGMANGRALYTKVLLDCSDMPSLTSLGRCLCIVEDPTTFRHCMCLGDLTLECFADEHLVATIGLHHGRSIRWNAWKHDAVLQDGTTLMNWLAERDVRIPDV
jgi:hypothetical protein